MRKVLTAILLTIFFVSSVAIIGVNASVDAKSEDNVRFKYNAGVLTVSGTGEMPKTTSYNNKTYITAVIVEEGVTSICTRAFYGCTNLSSIVLPDSIKKIDGQAFLNTAYYNNPNNWNNGALYIGNHLIETNDNLSETYSIKNGTITIGEKAFDNRKNLKSVTLPDSVKYICEYAFDRCPALTNIVMSKNIRRIDSYAFGYMGNSPYLQKIDLPNHAIDIASTAFSHTGYYISSDNWENGVLYIGNHLIDVKTYVTHCEVKKGTIDIAWAALEDCSKLKTVFIPNSVSHIGQYLIYNCPPLKIYFAGTETKWNEIVAKPNEDLALQTIIYEHEHSIKTVTGSNSTSATCTTDGRQTKISTCEECEIEVSRETIITPAKGHQFSNWSQTQAPTCTEDGLETRSCPNCKVSETQKLPALGHHFSKPAIINSPTCTAPGKEGGMCTRCNKEATNILPATGHKLKTFSIISEATCTLNGEKEGICEECGNKTKEIIPATGHKYGEYTIIKNPTETEPGIQAKTCKKCGDVSQETLKVIASEDKETTLKNKNSKKNFNWAYGLVGFLVFVGIGTVFVIKKKHK